MNFWMLPFRGSLFLFFLKGNVGGWAPQSTALCCLMPFPTRINNFLVGCEAIFTGGQKAGVYLAAQLEETQPLHLKRIVPSSSFSWSAPPDSLTVGLLGKASESTLAEAGVTSADSLAGCPLCFRLLLQRIGGFSLAANLFTDCSGIAWLFRRVHFSQVQIWNLFCCLFHCLCSVLEKVSPERALRLTKV